MPPTAARSNADAADSDVVDRETPAAGAPSPDGAGDTGAEPDDAALMTRIQADDDIDAFEMLFRRYERRIFSYLARLSRNRSDAEDYTQDVFLRLWRAREQYKPSGKFVAYLYRIARNHWINESKKRSLREPVGGIDAGELSLPGGHRSEMPDDALLTAEARERIEIALGELPLEQRETFVLARIQQLSYKEIAEITDVPVRTVESRLVLATRKLVAKLNDLHG
jgi:RNA polymerase sigma-70 factor (family 1)